MLLSLKNGRNEREAVELAGEAGIHILGLSEYFIGEMSPEDSHTVLLGYGTLDEEQIEKGLRRSWRQLEKVTGKTEHIPQKRPPVRKRPFHFAVGYEELLYSGAGCYPQARL